MSLSQRSGGRPFVVQTIEVRGRDPEPRRRFLPDPADIVDIAHIAQGMAVLVDIPYRYHGTRRRLRIFPGGWWDSEIRRDHGSERG
jgi:hypothetical protein